MASVRYFNFPIQLVHGFLNDSKSCLVDILSYCLYEHAYELETHDRDIERAMELAAKFYNISIINLMVTYERGEQLYNDYHYNSPMCGLNLNIYWDYRKNTKSDFEKICLLAFLAIKSIIGKKPFCKITNEYLISRMDGNVKSVNSSERSAEISRYENEYQLKKIRNHLEINWFLKCYGRQMRGFFVSFDLSREDLIYQVEVNRNKMKILKLHEENKIALENVRKRLQSELIKTRPI